MSFGSIEDKRLVKTTPSNGIYYLDPHNPFIQKHYQHGRSQLLITQDIIIPDEYIDRALMLDNKNCSVKIMCFCDLCLNAYYLLYNFLFGAFFCAISFNGFLSTIYHKKSLMICYVIYQYFLVFCRTANLVVIFYVYSNHIPKEGYYNITNTTNNQTVPYNQFKVLIIGNELIDATFGVIILCMQVFIAFYIKDYYDLLPSEDEKNIITISRI